MKYDIVSLGEPVIDFIPVEDDGMLCYRAYPGGGAVNVLAQASKMGARTLCIGTVGKDIFGEYLADSLRRQGIETDGLKYTQKKNTGIGFVRHDENGERSFLSYRDYDTDIELLDEKDSGLISEGKIFHFTGVSIAGKAQRRDTFAALKLAMDAGNRISFDVNYREQMWPEAESACEIFKKCIRCADIVKISEEERELLFPGMSNQECAEYMNPDHKKIIFISLGSEGCFYHYKYGSGIVPSLKVKAVDTTGCGDAFMGAILAQLAGYMEKGGFSIPEDRFRRLVQKANAAGAICATRQGALNAVAEKEEVERFLRKKVVVIGAGLSGRGYIARQLDREKYALVFVEKNSSLVAQMRNEKTYQIHFFGKKRASVAIEEFEIYLWQEPEAKKALTEADYIFTCVGQENLTEVAGHLADILQDSDSLEEKTVIAAENGAKSMKILQQVFARKCEGHLPCISQCLMLCTCMKTENGLDIVSEDTDFLPYDSREGTCSLPFAAFESCDQFEILEKRKLYTYNCISAAIAYIGAYKGYLSYGEAANDPEIILLTDRLCEVLDQAICLEYGVELQVQKAFSVRALVKFRNLEIADSIERNARDVRRKLAPEDRMIAPLNIMRKHGIETNILEKVIAAAYLYGEMQNVWRKENGEGTIREVLMLVGDITDEDILRNTKEAYENLVKNMRAGS